MPNEEISTPLSERELQVLQMVVTGASNQEIARQLVISVNTVKVHMRNIFEKLEVQSRTEASLRAIQEGWVSVAEDEANQSAESATPLLKTYLVANNQQTAVAPWQQLYLAGMILLALAVAIIPLLFAKPQNTYVPIIPVSAKSEQSLYNSNDSGSVPTPPQGNANRWTFREPMPTQRAGLAVAAFDRKIYAIGGVRSNDQATRFVEIYDPATNSWIEGAAKPTATTNISSVVLNDKIYVPGGCTNDRQAIDALEIYDPRIDKWAQGKALPEPRCGYGLVAFDGKLYLFGGWDGQAYRDTVFVFSPRENWWQVLDSAMPSAMGYMGAATLAGTIYIAGGYDERSEFAQTYLFDPRTEEWTEKAPMQEKRGGLGLVNIAEHLYAVGGGWNQPLETSEKYDSASDTWSSFETPFANRWRNLGLTVLDTEIYAVGGWDGSEEEYMDAVASYNVLFQLFLPITTGK